MTIKTEAAQDRLQFLDLMRFIAAVMVMMYHFTYHGAQVYGTHVPPHVAATRHGFLGVDIFFMISGFVILWSAVGRSGGIFVRARILRLFPEFWLAVLFSTVVFSLVPGGFLPTVDARQIAGNLTMIPGFLGVPFIDGVYWTLVVELKFYAIVWLLMVTRQLPRLEWFLYAWIGACVMAEFVEVGRIRSLILYPHGQFFAAGGLFFLCFQRGWTAWRAIGLLVALPLCVNSSIDRTSGFVDPLHITPVMHATTTAIICLAFAAFASLPLLRNVRWPRWVATAGLLTYPLYLVHNTGNELFLHQEFLGLSEAVRVVIAVVFALGMAWLIMRVARIVVSPVLRWVLNAVGLREWRPASRASNQGLS